MLSTVMASITVMTAIMKSNCGDKLRINQELLLYNIYVIIGCYTDAEHCNGVNNCDDGYDESNCGDKSRIDQELLYRYRMSRQACIKSHSI